jgi:hypothetical protein
MLFGLGLATKIYIAVEGTWPASFAATSMLTQPPHVPFAGNTPMSTTASVVTIWLRQATSKAERIEFVSVGHQEKPDADHEERQGIFMR